MANYKKKKIPVAFTFIEISVTIIVISILTFIILGGSKSLFSSSSLAKARSLTINAPVAKIDGLIAWYETSLPESFKSSESYHGAQITEWRDINPQSISSEKNKLTKTAGADVTYFQDELYVIPAVYFSTAGNISLSNFSQGNLMQATVFVVFSPATGQTTTVYEILVGSGPSNPDRRVGIYQGTNRVYFYAGNAEVATATTSNVPNFGAGSQNIMAAYFNFANTKAYINDAVNMTGGSLVNLGSTMNSFQGLTLGTETAGNWGYDGLIAEVIIYNRPLNLDERKAVMGYLAKKYSISVTGL